MKPILLLNLTIITKINNIAATLKESYLRLNLLRTEEINTFSSIVANLWDVLYTTIKHFQGIPSFLLVANYKALRF